MGFKSSQQQQQQQQKKPWEYSLTFAQNLMTPLTCHKT